MNKSKAPKSRVNRQGRKFKAEVDTNIMSIGKFEIYLDNHINKPLYSP